MIRELFWKWGPWAYNKASYLIYRSKQVVKVIYNEILLEKEWVFLKGIQIPISSESFGQIENLNVRWRCKMNPPRFLEPVSFVKEKHLSYLGFNVKIPGRADLDLSDWINDIHYIGSSEPTVSDIFCLWCCENNVSYFHLFDLIQVECINELGDTIKKGLNE